MDKNFNRKLGILLIIAGIIVCAIPFFQPNPFFIKKPVLPEDAPITELNKLTYSETLNDSFTNGIITYSDMPIKITYSFTDKKIESVRGYWYSDNSYLRISSPFTQNYDGTVKYTKNHWGDEIFNPSNKKIKDLKFTTTITIDKSLLHQYLSLEADMTIHYPYYVENGYGNRNQELKKEFQLYVATPEEVKYVQWYNLKDDQLHWVNGHMAFFIATLILIYLGIMGIVMKETPTNKPTSKVK